MRGTLEVALKAYLHPRHQHCIDEAQKAETVLSAVSLIKFLQSLKGHNLTPIEL